MNKGSNMTQKELNIEYCGIEDCACGTSGTCITCNISKKRHAFRERTGIIWSIEND